MTEWLCAVVQSFGWMNDWMAVCCGTILWLDRSAMFSVVCCCLHQSLRSSLMVCLRCDRYIEKLMDEDQSAVEKRKAQQTQLRVRLWELMVRSPLSCIAARHTCSSVVKKTKTKKLTSFSILISYVIVDQAIYHIAIQKIFKNNNYVSSSCCCWILFV